MGRRSNTEAGVAARHEVRAKLEELILTGRRPPGARLPQVELAEEFSVAQGVVREALIELQASGLVQSVDNRGMFVANLSAERLLESFEIREMHEALAVRLCCERVTRADVRSLRSLAHEIYQQGVRSELQEMAVLDRDLHARLIHLSGNSMLDRLAQNYRVFGKILRANRDPLIVRDEHLSILKAIEEGCADDAERLVRQHIAAARLAVEKQFKVGMVKPRWVP